MFITTFKVLEPPSRSEYLKASRFIDKASQSNVLRKTEASPENPFDVSMIDDENQNPFLLAENEISGSFLLENKADTQVQSNEKQKTQSNSFLKFASSVLLLLGFSGAIATTSFFGFANSGAAYKIKAREISHLEGLKITASFLSGEINEHLGKLLSNYSNQETAAIAQESELNAEFAPIEAENINLRADWSDIRALDSNQVVGSVPALVEFLSQGIRTPDTHIVRAGESLAAIADDYSMSFLRIKELNRDLGDLIYEGDKVNVEHVHRPPIDFGKRSFGQSFAEKANKAKTNH